MPLIQRIPGVTFPTDLGLPKIYVDPMLRQGSLYLVEPAHPYEPTVGVPTGGAALPNIAGALAAPLLGSTEAQVKPTISIGGRMNGASGRLERTGKGGLHSMIAQTGTIDGNQSVRVTLPTAIQNYIYANRTHQLYFSMWHRITRAVPADQIRAMYGLIGSTDVNYLAAFTQQGDFPPAGANRVGATTTNQGSVGNSFRAIATAGPTAGFGTLNNVNEAYPYMAGRNSNFSFAGGGSNSAMLSPSHILYRIYAEDLNVSGRTFVEAAAADQAAYTAEVLTAGGRYFGDTFSDPAAIVP